jgi:hypothetical protein
MALNYVAPPTTLTSPALHERGFLWASGRASIGEMLGDPAAKAAAEGKRDAPVLSPR